MAQKKCPKCGEDNPAEAVMCWACYTPLSGGAAVAAGAAGGAMTKPGAGPMPPGGADDGEKKKMQLDPKTIGLLAFLFIGGGVGVFMNLPKAPTEGDPPPTEKPPDAPKAPETPPPVGVPPLPATTGAIPSATTEGAGELSYTVVAPPSPRHVYGTMGIMPTKPGTTPQQAVGLARTIKGPYLRAGNIKNLQIYVFGNQQAAETFKDYQSKRRGYPLTTPDFHNLADQGVWNGTLAVYEIKGGKENYLYPYAKPDSWWVRSGN